MSDLVESQIVGFLAHRLICVYLLESLMLTTSNKNLKSQLTNKLFIDENCWILHGHVHIMTDRHDPTKQVDIMPLELNDLFQDACLIFVVTRVLRRPLVP